MLIFEFLHKVADKDFEVRSTWATLYPSSLQTGVADMQILPGIAVSCSLRTIVPFPLPPSIHKATSRRTFACAITSPCSPEARVRITPNHTDGHHANSSMRTHERESAFAQLHDEIRTLRHAQHIVEHDRRPASSRIEHFEEHFGASP
jgi:hypothetical protein